MQLVQLIFIFIVSMIIRIVSGCFTETETLQQGKTPFKKEETLHKTRLM